MIKQYFCKAYLNAKHSVKINGKEGQIHSHCFEIAVDLTSMDENFISFTAIEKVMDKFLAPYQERYVNEVYPFSHVTPTLENMADYFKVELDREFDKQGWLLLSLEMSETPSRTFVMNVAEDIAERRLFGDEVRLLNWDISVPATKMNWDVEVAPEDMHYDVE